jgi:hypothetical protein
MAGSCFFPKPMRSLGLCEKLAGALANHRDQDRVAHSQAVIVQSLVLAIAYCYEDGNDLNALRFED